MNRGVVYGLWDYTGENPDELSFREGDCMSIVRREDEDEIEWWWARMNDTEGYIPRNLLGVRHQSLNLLQEYRFHLTHKFTADRLFSPFVSEQLYPRIKPRQRTLA